MRDPFKIDSPTCISFSGGRTSAYMLWRVLQANDGLPEEAKVCFANTGKEEEATLRFVQDCQDSWNVEIVWLEYQPSGYRQVTFETASRQGEPFEELIRKKKYLPNPVARFCTEELKVKTIDRYFKAQGIEPETMVGVRFDEPRRVGKLRQRGLLIPLVDVGVTQAIVQEFWRAQPFDLELVFQDGVTPLGNCDLCFLKGPQQIMGLIKDKPQRAVWWASMEQVVGATFRSDRASYGEMHKFLSDQADMFNADGGVECFCGD
jgi:hypothetical protein